MKGKDIKKLRVALGCSQVAMAGILRKKSGARIIRAYEKEELPIPEDVAYLCAYIARYGVL